jgi:hypothetical protein
VSKALHSILVGTSIVEHLGIQGRLGVEVNIQKTGAQKIIDVIGYLIVLG